MRRRRRRCCRLKENLREITKEKKTGLSLCAPYFFFCHLHFTAAATAAHSLMLFASFILSPSGEDQRLPPSCGSLSSKIHTWAFWLFFVRLFFGEGVEWWGRRRPAAPRRERRPPSLSQFHWLLVVVARSVVVGGSIKPAAESHSSFRHVNY